MIKGENKACSQNRANTQRSTHTHTHKKKKHSRGLTWYMCREYNNTAIAL